MAFIQDIYHIRFYFFLQKRKLKFPLFWLQIMDTFVTFLTAKIEEYFVRVEIRQCQSNCEEARVFRLTPFALLRKLKYHKQSFQSELSFNFVPVVPTSFVSL